MSGLLIVDDEPEYLDELVEALALRGVNALSVERGADALELLAQDSGITVILSDMRMPDMDGLALVEAVKTAWPDRAITFFIMTGHATDDDMQKALAKGVTRCFPKPLAFECLCEALSACNNSREE